MNPRRQLKKLGNKKKRKSKVSTFGESNTKTATALERSELLYCPVHMEYIFLLFYSWFHACHFLKRHTMCVSQNHLMFPTDVNILFPRDTNLYGNPEQNFLLLDRLVVCSKILTKRLPQAPSHFTTLTAELTLRTLGSFFITNTCVIMHCVCACIKQQPPTQWLKKTL